MIIARRGHDLSPSLLVWVIDHRSVANLVRQLLAKWFARLNVIVCKAPRRNTAKRTVKVNSCLLSKHGGETSRRR